MTADAIAVEAPLRSWTLTDEEIQLTVAKLEKINAHAAKRGLQNTWTWTFGEETRVPVFDDADCRTVINGIPHFFEQGRPVPCPLIGWERKVELLVFGEPPKLAGWKFIATLTWDGAILVTRCHPEFEGRIDETTIRDYACDHCKADRQRRDCYLLENEQGERVQVGSTCIKDFLGHDFRPSWIADSDDLDSIVSYTPAGSGRYLDATVLDVLTWAASITTGTGWISRAKAEEWDRTPSVYTLTDCLFGSGKLGREARAKYEPTDDHKAEAAKVLEWARALDPGDSEYLANVKRCAEANYIGYRNCGLLGSAVASYWRAHNERIEREARPVSQHIGTVKQRLELVLVVRSDTAIEGDYGVRHLYTFTDLFGNVVKWFSSHNQCWTIGQQVSVKATVKRHDVWKDINQTVITRATQI
jgi:hypothetical protein